MLPRAFARLNRRTLIAPAAIVDDGRDRLGVLLDRASAPGRRCVPREPLQLRRPARVHGGAGRRDPAALTEPDLARPFRAPVERPDPRGGRAGRRPRRRAAHLRDLDRRARDPRRCAHRRPALARLGAVVYVGSRLAARERARARTPAVERPRPRDRGRLRADPRAAEARPDRRGGARRPRSGWRRSAAAPSRSTSSGCRSTGRSTPTCSSRGARSSVARRGEAARGGGTASRSRSRSCGRASLGEAIVEEAERHGADLIVLGSAPRWRRQSRFFSPTVDYVLRKAPCEVMVVAYPQGVLEDELVVS